MPLYEIACVTCGTQEVVARMSDAGEFMACPICQRPRPQVFRFGAHTFTEDRLRLWKGPLGTGYSNALGAPMPATRAQRDRVARERGVEFCSREDFLASNQEAAEAVEYAAHVHSGGAREDARPAASADWKSSPTWPEGLK